MEYVARTMREIALFIDRVAERLNAGQVEKLLDALISSYKRRAKVLVMGAGRSGLVGKAFAMRLMHLGFNVYVLGETITPSIGRGDLVVAISGSGRTKLIVTAAEAAKKVEATVAAITSYPESPLGQLADIVVEVPGRTKSAPDIDYFARQILGIHEPLAPLGTLFEDTALAFLDGIVVELMNRLGKKEDDLRAKHANIEF
ncbi:MAG: 6-phospho-3-hexuloisomerase [Hyperthermus sp.]|nr:MAG: 6-phospho-3-hexuloisomerase [Hyperthermus sp.]